MYTPPYRPFARVVVFTGLTATAIFAQGKGTPTAPSPNRPPTSPTNPATSGGTTQQQISYPDQRPFFLSGKVVLNDGTPPPEPVPIRLVCGGNPRSVGYTDTKGRFNIDLSSRTSSAMFSDASETGYGRFSNSPMQNTNGLAGNSGGAAGTDRSLVGCDLQAYFPGFRSDLVSLASHRSLDNPDVGQIVLHRLANVEGLSISITTAMAPKDAKKAYDKGMAEAKKGKWDGAEREFTKAVEAYPKFAVAWYELGHAQHKQQKFAEARASYGKAVEADPKYVSPYEQLADLAVRESKWEDAVAATDKLLRLNPVDFPLGWYYSALANYQLKRYEPAEKSALSGLKADSTHRLVKLEELLAYIKVENQDLRGAVDHFKAYLQLSPQAPDAEQVKNHLAQVERAIGGTTNAAAKKEVPEKQ